MDNTRPAASASDRPPARPTPRHAPCMRARTTPATRRGTPPAVNRMAGFAGRCRAASCGMRRAGAGTRGPPRLRAGGRSRATRSRMSKAHVRRLLSLLGRLDCVGSPRPPTARRGKRGFAPLARLAVPHRLPAALGLGENGSAGAAARVGGLGGAGGSPRLLAAAASRMADRGVDTGKDGLSGRNTGAGAHLLTLVPFVFCSGR